jgi:Tol biopolymer transport system component
MTTPTRLERELPSILGDIAMGPYPEYVEDVLALTQRSRQRPAWTFPERWLPMTDITRRRAFAPSAPLRAITLILLLVAILIAAVLVASGSRSQRLPAPFGPAANGQLLFSANDDIVSVDPSTGAVTTLLGGPERDVTPVSSPDGRSIAFLRHADLGSTVRLDIVVAGIDGSHPTVMTPSPIVDGPELFEWSPDSRSILVDQPGDDTLRLYDATKSAQPRIVATNTSTYIAPFQPPAGGAILLLRTDATRRSMVRLDLRDSSLTTLVGVPATSTDDLGGARWSPDGSAIAYNKAPGADAGQQRIHLVAADGTAPHQLSLDPGVWYETDLVWSPDGTRIAFNHWLKNPTSGEWQVRPIGIISVADGTTVTVGPMPPSGGYRFDWSPDGRSLIAITGDGTGHPTIIDAHDGTARELAVTVDSSQSWQRVALP